jgi:hypothetical protein
VPKKVGREGYKARQEKISSLGLAFCSVRSLDLLRFQKSVTVSVRIHGNKKRSRSYTAGEFTPSAHFFKSSHPLITLGRAASIPALVSSEGSIPAPDARRIGRSKPRFLSSSAKVRPLYLSLASK